MIAPGNSPAARATPAPHPGSGIASESRKTTTSPLAAAQPRLRLPPAEGREPGGTILAPDSSARLLVASVDPSSTTRTSRGAGFCPARDRRTLPSVRSAFRAGMTTLYDCARDADRGSFTEAVARSVARDTVPSCRGLEFVARTGGLETPVEPGRDLADDDVRVVVGEQIERRQGTGLEDPQIETIPLLLGECRGR